MEDIRVLTPTGNVTSFHISEMQSINIASENYISTRNSGILIKNDTMDTTDPANPQPKAVLLEVMLVNDSEFIFTYFAPGWNPEIVKAINQSAIVGINIKQGY